MNLSELSLEFIGKEEFNAQEITAILSQYFDLNKPIEISGTKPKATAEVFNFKTKNSLYVKLETSNPLSKKTQHILHRIFSRIYSFIPEDQLLESHDKKTNHHHLLIEHLINQSSDAVHVLKEDGSLYYINSKSSKRLNIEQKDCSKYKIWDIEKMFESKSGWDSFLEELKEKESLLVEAENYNKQTKQTYPIEVTAKYIKLNGEAYILAILRDISDRLKSQNQIKQLSKFTSENPSPTLRINQEGLLLYYNDASQELVATLGCEVNRPVKLELFEKIKTGLKNLSSFDFEFKLKDRTFLMTAVNVKNENYINIYGKDITRIKQLESELSSQEQLLRHLFNNSPSGLVLCDQKTKTIQLANKAFANISGYLNTELLKLKINDLFEDYNIDKLDERDYTFQLKTKKGNTKHLRVQPIDFNGDKTGRTWTIFHDITKEIEANLEISRQIKFQNLLIDISAKYINISLKKVNEAIQKSLEEVGQFVKVDRAYIFDYDFDNNTTSNTYEWCNTSITPEIDNLQNVPVDYIPFWIDQHKKGEPLYIPNVQNLPKDGENGLRDILEPQGIKSLITFPLKDEFKLYGFIGFDSVKNYREYSDEELALLKVFANMLVNINKRKNWETTLKIQESKYRNILNNTNLGLFEINLDQKLTFANNSFKNLLDLSKENINQFDVTKLGINQNQISGKEVSLVVNNTHKEFYLSTANNFDINLKHKGEIGILLDITKQKKLEKDLEKASEAKELFLTNMSHEIRTPLNVIIGMVRELSKMELTQKPQEYILKTNSAAEHLLSVINNILDIKKIEANEMFLEQKAFSLYELIVQIKNILEYKAQEKKLKLIVDHNISKSLELIGDEGKLRQVLINLLGNAIKFTETGFIKLKVTTKLANNNTIKISFLIEDTGVGISKDFLGLVFNKFTQEKTSFNRTHEGSGLGMSITNEIIKRMGGTINIDSQPNKGTTVRFNLDFKIEKQKHSLEKKYPLTQFNHETILVAEDNEASRMIICKNLTDLGFNVLEAKNGLEAIEIVKNNQIGLIFMDIQMPEVDGLEATRRIRQDLHVFCPIIAFTANAFHKDITYFLKQGLNDYLLKPYRKNEIEEKLYLYFEQNQVGFSIDDLKEAIPDQIFLKDLIETLAQGIEKSAVLIYKSFHENDFENFVKVAHKLKTSLAEINCDLSKQFDKYQNIKIEEFNKISENNIYKALQQLDYIYRNLGYH